MARVWDVPVVELPRFIARLVRSSTGLAIIALAFLANAFVTALADGEAAAVRIALVAGVAAANVAAYFLAFVTLTPALRRRRDVLPGATLGGVGFTALTVLGTNLVQHQLRNASNTYGAFASVIGVVTYLLLLATVTLYAAELNPVLARRLWPRPLAGSVGHPARRKPTTPRPRNDNGPNPSGPGPFRGGSGI